MGLDALAKRYAPLVICLLLGIAAYFQASGMAQLVGALVAPPGDEARAGTTRKPLLAAIADGRDTSAAAILTRNPFDSITGPLHPPAPAPSASGEAPPGADRDPYADPPCDVARVVLIASSGDPDWSFAALQGPDGKTTLHRRGSGFFGGKVDFIGSRRAPDDPRPAADDPAHALWERVWLVAPNGTRCQLALGAKPNMPKMGPTPPPAQSGAAGTDVMSKIRKVRENEFEVDRSAVEAIIANPSELMKTRVVPEKEGDRVVGLKLLGIRPGSLLGNLGIENGDRLTSINGFEMNDPVKMVEAYNKLLRADHLAVDVVRNGKPMSIGFNIK
jgi:general secretion pathway protein C